MAALSTIALIGGLAMAGAGTVTQTVAAGKAAEANQEGIAAQQRVEESRRQAMELDAQRKKREMVRQGIVARGQSLAQASSQGAQFSSGYEGAQASITEQTGYNILGVNQNLQIGEDIFAANKDLLNARKRESQAQAFGAIGQGVSTLGGALLKNIGNIDRIGGVAKGYLNG